MARRGTQFVCQECGSVYPKWTGRCSNCSAWNSLVEEAPAAPAPGKTGQAASGGRALATQPLKVDTPAPPRRTSGIAELDRVCGGGFVAGASLLVGGDPGIGKSTLLLQAAAAVANGGRVIYVSGEEAPDQVRLRAERLGLSAAPVDLLATTSVNDLIATLKAGPPPDLLIVDSIQTMYLEGLDSAPGTVSQVRSCAHALIHNAKDSGMAVILVGHVTKEGQIAGPRVLEHMVDSVLYFEGDSSHHYRILRTVKNRFGPTDEIGVFEMTGGGLREIANPSELFLAQRAAPVPGTAVFAGIEGSRPLLIEIQALVTPGQPGNARRAVVGWDSGRLAMVLAVLQARGGLNLAGLDVYLTVVGGIRVQEPAADMAVAASLISAATNRPMPASCIAFGEIGLTGEIRPVNQPDLRLREAAKLGFDRAMHPAESGTSEGRAMALHELGHVAELVSLIGGNTNAGGA